MEWVPCEFFLIRYVPNVVRDTHVNIGVILREVQSGGRSMVRFTRDWRDVRCLDPEADVGMFEALEQEIARRIDAGISVKNPKDLIEDFEDSLSNSIQITSGQARLAENLETDMESLSRMYVEPMKVSKVRVKSGRALILDQMRKEFGGFGVWRRMDMQIRASRFTYPGDSLRIDCGYSVEAVQASPNAIIRMFQAVSLETNEESAKVLAFSAQQLRDGVRRVEKAQLELTAVVEPLRTVAKLEDDSDDAMTRYRFGVKAMEAQAIRVITVKELPGAARTAGRELGA